MSAGLPSDEVVDDYKNSLDDLVTNDRISIGNLTVIAKECIEHAQAIARVLENHILRAPPARKLPAFYVLDSIAKNVGTPYTVYFGLNLFQTYMNTFASVDNNVRRKLDEMRKTWSQPVPGSQSTYPVFQKTVTSKIDEAMDSWARKQFPNRTPQTAYRGPVAQISAQQNHSTPTPPLMQPHNQQGYAAYHQHPDVNGAVLGMNQSHPYSTVPAQHVRMPPSQYSQPAAPAPTPQPYLPQSQQPYGQQLSYPSPAPPPANVDVDYLKRDIDDLIVDAKIGSYSNPMDRASQQKLASLQSLKEIVDSGALSQRDAIDVRRSISEQLAARSSRQPDPPPAPMTQPPLSYPHQQHNLAALKCSPPPLTTPSFLTPTNLAELLRATAPRSRPTPLPFQVQTSPIPQHTGQSPNPQTHVVPSPAENPLIAQLRASGLFSSQPTPPPLGSSFTPPAATHVSYNSNTTKYSLNGFSTTPSVVFTSSSLKTPRPELLKQLFDARPNRCNTCGRRFTSDEHGREKKARHLDWHFKTRTRMVEAERRGIQRSWYVDELEWIRSREYDDDENNDGDQTVAGDDGREHRGAINSSASATATNKSQARTPKESYLRVPNDAKLRADPCPICQEKFESMWSEELQDFIWRDAVQVGGSRVYHASCFVEATRDRENTATTPVPGGSAAVAAVGRTRTATPDSVLGKRKIGDAGAGAGAGAGANANVSIDGQLDPVKSVKVKIEQG